jgi:hypothetical protein
MFLLDASCVLRDGARTRFTVYGLGLRFYATGWSKDKREGRGRGSVCVRDVCVYVCVCARAHIPVLALMNTQLSRTRNICV